MTRIAFALQTQGGPINSIYTDDTYTYIIESLYKPKKEYFIYNTNETNKSELSYGSKKCNYYAENQCEDIIKECRDKFSSTTDKYHCYYNDFFP